MTSVAEYVLPGISFILFGTWWASQMLKRYYRSRFDRSLEYVSTLTFPCSCCGRGRNFQLEGIMKLLFSISWAVTALVAAVITKQPEDNFNPNMVKYFLISFFFGFSGVIDIVMVHSKNVLPKNTDYVFFILAFLVQGFLQNNNIYGTSIIYGQLHLFVVYTCFATVVCLLAEMRWPNNVLFALGRAFFVLLQGTWTFQISAIIHQPLPMNLFKWNMNDPKLILRLTEMFACHLWFIFFGMVISAVIIRRLSARGSRPLDRHEDVTMELIPQEVRGNDENTLYEISDD